MLYLTREACDPPLKLSVKEIAEITGLNYHSLQTASKNWVRWKLISSTYSPGKMMNVYQILNKGVRLLKIQRAGFFRVNSLGNLVYYHVDVQQLINVLEVNLKKWIAKKRTAKQVTRYS
ncbi:hypothetical protein ACFLYB_00005, partial [Chloroflexota bacterium]